MAKLLGTKRIVVAAIFLGLMGTLVAIGCRVDPELDAVETSAQNLATQAESPPAAADVPILPTVTQLEEPLDAPKGVPEELETVWEVWALLAKEHVDRGEFDSEVFTEAAIRGMLIALGDPHTNYVPPEAFNIENEDLLGRFEGIGANVSLTPDGKLVVVAPISGSPAEQAGIKPGDTILEVDGESLEGLSLLESVNKIRGLEAPGLAFLYSI